MSQVDTVIMLNLQMFIRSVLALLGTFVIIGISTYYVLVPFIPVLLLFVGVQNFYRSTSVQLKRLDAVSRSPIYAHFTESLGGISTIRAYLAQDRMFRENAHKLDENQKIYIMSLTSNRWLSIRLEFLGGILIVLTAFNCVILRHSLDPSAAGLAMAYSLQITAGLNLLVRISTEMENSFNAVERVQEYSDIVSEAPRESKNPKQAGWFAQGKVDVENLTICYREGMAPVLKKLSFSINPGEKVGVCGRTGAGKSTMFQTFFRMMEATEGSIKFDGVDISTLGLDDLRKAISIIPQEPVLFSGTLRFNLDPFDDYSDASLWSALERANLKDVITMKGENLLMKVAEGGENFSVGQRQLLCLARALLRKSKLLVLDEATANVDAATDALIQKTIRENFADRTSLTIAHRLNTIIDCDKILVLEFGTVKEFDTPRNLMMNPQSEFYSMVQETGEQNATFLKSVALGGVQALDDSLAELAKQQLLTQDFHDLAHYGPLMQDVLRSAMKFQDGWDQRRSKEWRQELEEQQVSLSLWMETMAAMLQKVNKAADHALQEEDLHFEVYGHHESILGVDGLHH